MTRVLVTGASGFIAKNLIARLNEENYDVIKFEREDNITLLDELLKNTDFIFHLAGTNRPKENIEFKTGNADFTLELIKKIKAKRKKIPIIFTSSIQIYQNNEYGRSKLEAENYLLELSKELGNPVLIYRLPNVFGKWCKPNYNSVIATFCHNIANGLSIIINDKTSKLELVYIDDVINTFISDLNSLVKPTGYYDIPTKYHTTVGEVSDILFGFEKNRSTLMIDSVGRGLVRALYSTYLSYLPTDKFSYEIPVYADARGKFAEVLKTPESGQFSFFTALPGVTRGGHYHHSKNEKFIVLSGTALFAFRNIITNECKEEVVSSEQTKVVETVPGWAHNIKNIGNTELVVMLWANEIFDREKPDTIPWEI
ncbi:SDR family oxidoreductase [Yersinia enterocolitica]|uniref:UDP-2-acetamido-2,6-beta-L-arabino-hexul-4-ose reductase n=1 Tax=Yersinia enterocolitica TaxID=630 RepID=UPI00155B0D3C|nr:NAD-dependent epimerase/dehydratase family protein [Yersinia enterocolitica]MBX9482608.1 NAD-dependent epimerase/dehydratase family protein [Yersinia enterocolitica]NQS94650.1 SDR family oxidoreductase [Yersinia enterocolitica]NQT44860.1 SDR family oxidoreductase [Yersinia enterocolitica]NQT99349.1 SDR family oxidoreductase [Yersinia enterocolitica]HDL6874753.1 NAD-dependent epimerase/dehydratase family protein [Yersinia enterocolitica]